MAQSPSMPVLAMPTTTGAELTQAEAELWCHNFGYLKSMALQCAIKLGIPTAIHGHGGAASLPELHAAVPVAASKRPCLSRIMIFLSTSGIFREEKNIIIPDAAAAPSQAAEQPRYHLTTASRLLVDAAGGRTCVAQLLTLCSSPSYFAASQNLAAWLQKEEDDDAGGARTPFAMAHGGAGFYEVVGRDAAFGACFDGAMGADSGFVWGIVVCEHGEVFDGVASVVDVGGHDGTTARAIAKAFPHVRCTVLDLPRVVDAMATADGDGTVEFVAGDMREFIPPADAVLFKCVLHNWSDEDCVQILKRAKEAVSTREPKGKVVITEVVLPSPSKQTLELEAQLLMDLCMMVVLEGKERTEEEWHKIFLDAGFTRYKITPISGTTRSLIEVFP